MHLCTSVCNILNMATSYRTVENLGNYSNLPSFLPIFIIFISLPNAYGSQLPATRQC